MNAKAKAKQNKKRIGTPYKWGDDPRSSLIAAHKASDPGQLKKMAGDILSGKVKDTGDISEELICNKNLHFDEAKKLARKWGGRFACELCDRHDATAAALKENYKHFDAISAEAFMDHPNIDSAARRKLADLVKPTTIVWMISHNEIPVLDLNKYIDHKSALVRESVAATCNDPTMLKFLAKDEEVKVREAVANNPAVPIKIVEKMALRNDNLTAKVVAAMRTSNPKLLMVLADNLSSREDVHVAQAIKENDQAPDCDETHTAKIVATLRENQLQ